MNETELRPYHRTDNGTIEIGRFSALATWRESGIKPWHFSGSMHGGEWTEGALAESVEFQVSFDELSLYQMKTLAEALSDWYRTPQTHVAFSLNGTLQNGLYLHSMKFDESNRPRGIVFSNSPPPR